ncbi:hypothetical protein WN55_01278 [Dufourea novaeangliae]|uniref:Uncharacterized protein n=1 Tax=Dufourea novaeangliae TaxID=178035 RepID=A0A154NWJ4_DUFNO|nr:hypothetical protein WN55_01278 [Dufourea novaeangliae]
MKDIVNSRRAIIVLQNGCKRITTYSCLKSVKRKRRFVYVQRSYDHDLELFAEFANGGTQ